MKKSLKKLLFIVTTIYFFGIGLVSFQPASAASCSNSDSGSPDNPIYCNVGNHSCVQVGKTRACRIERGVRNYCGIMTLTVDIPSYDSAKANQVISNFCAGLPTQAEDSSTSTPTTDSGTSTNTTTTTDSTTEDDEDSGASSGGPFNGTCRYILGLTSWDCGVNIHDEDSLKTGIWTIVANIATDITVIAAYLVLGYVIYGGYLYSFSGGDPAKVTTGKKTLVQAFTGLAIVMLANVIMNAIRFVLLGNGGVLGACDIQTGAGACVDPTNLVTGAINWFIAIAGLVSVIFIIYGGITYITSSGDPSKTKKAKDMILYSLIGLAIVALATIITAFVSNLIKDASTTSLLNETTISKEVYEIKIN